MYLCRRLYVYGMAHTPFLHLTLSINLLSIYGYIKIMIYTVLIINIPCNSSP